MTADDHR